jgi:FkbM family methyltransferase
MVRTYKNWVRLVLYRLNIAPQPMIVRVRDGSRFRIRNRTEQNADAYVLNESFLYGIHDDMLPYMKNARIGIDIGAHIGTFSVYAAKRSSATIYAIEPDSDNLALLKENISMNALGQRIIPLQTLITNETGSKELFLFRNRGLNSVFKDHGESFGEPSVGSRTLPSITLEELFQKNNITFCDFMKVDVEGAEYDIFFNLPQSVYDRIGVMGLEIGKDNKEALVEHIRSKGFRVERPRAEFSEYFCVNERRLRS